MFKKYRTQIIVVIVAIVLICLPSKLADQIRLTTKNILAPITEPLFQNSLALRKLSITLSELSNLPKQNDDLSAEVSRLLVENARLKEVDHTNSLLLNELNINKNSGERKLVSARIVYRSTYIFQDKVTIDAGSVDGVTVGLPVTSNGSLVGKITSVSTNSSEVELITSSTAITQAQLQESRTTGIARGGISGLVLQDIPLDTKIIKGESVLTSGLGGSLRAGLLIGTVSEIISTKNDVFQSAVIAPTVSISRLDMVFVELP